MDRETYSSEAGGRSLRTGLATVSCVWLLAACSTEGSSDASIVPMAKVESRAVGEEAGAVEDDSSNPGEVDSEAEGEAAVDTGSVSLPAESEEPVDVYSQPEVWAYPISDYVEVGKNELGSLDFNTRIQDLAIYEDRMYVAYGDATNNLGGHIPIGARYFASEESTETITDFETAEEQVERYRQFDGRLFIAGIDGTVNDNVGNVYQRAAAGEWSTSHTLSGGVHVHDVCSFEGEVWAVGSGSVAEEWDLGDIYAHAWRSSDGGETFEVAERIYNDRAGDARWVRLLPIGDTLWLFGYRTNEMFQINDLIGARYSQDSLSTLPSLHPLRWAFVIDTDTLPEGRGLVRGVDVSMDELRHSAWTISQDGSVNLVAGLADVAVLDVTESDGRTMLLLREGNGYADLTPALPWKMRIAVTDDLVNFETQLHFDSDVEMISLAAWRDQVFLGDADGAVWRSSPRN